jgi:choline monooxygenase
VLRGFFNVCRHHAAAVLSDVQGRADKLRCPYHGWTYSLRGELKSVPDFAGVCDFDRSATGLVPVDVDVWEKWVFVRLERTGTNLGAFLSSELIDRILPLDLGKFQWFERRTYTVECNWKVFVDNYLDGGYHVPHVHKGLDSVLDYSNYTIHIGERYCLQSSPLTTEGADPQTGAVRGGDRAFYYWIYPNFMINWYEGALDTNLVLPDGVNQTKVIIDYYFPDISIAARKHNLDSIAIGESIQEEDAAICKSVQRGLNSRAYTAGRLSVRREGGEHLFHRLLSVDLRSAI